MGIESVDGTADREERAMETREQDSSMDDFVALFAAGTRATGQYRCASCGYGITLHSKLPSCPMCGGESWEQAAWTPFARSVEVASERAK